MAHYDPAQSLREARGRYFAANGLGAGLQMTANAPTAKWNIGQSTIFSMQALQGSRMTGAPRCCDPCVEAVEPALEVGDRDVLRENRSEVREACDRLLEVCDWHAERQPGVAFLGPGRIVGACDEAAQASRRTNGALRRAGEVVHAQSHRDVLFLQP